jgi:predicted DsbA family dithiol-disulfide isomerase
MGIDINPAARRRLDVWSDIACPWCFIGKRRLDTALAKLPEADRPAVFYRAFELRPDLPPHHNEPARPMLEAKFGGAQRFAEVFARVQGVASACGINYDLDRQIAVNTRLAHRGAVLAGRLAKDTGQDDSAVQAAVIEGLFQAYFEQGQNLGDLQVVAHLVAEATGAEVKTARTRLADGEAEEEVVADEAEARALGIGGVPFFVLDGRLGMSGAQEVETFGAFLAAP